MLKAEHPSDINFAEWTKFETASRAWRGSAIELWVTLFYMHRADHFSAYLVPINPPAGYEPPDPFPPRPELDALCLALRKALIEGQHWPEQLQSH